jgi:ATP-binding cassette subfamily F protein uup
VNCNHRAANLQVAYFDQLRDQLDLNKSAVDNIAEGRDFIEIDGKSKHIFSYLSDFLFTGERARTPLRTLSGGERNRVLLAKLFSKTANLLVLDEPTNDLDVETLELLEDILVGYSGTVLLVSHDRAFLNNIVTSVIAFEGRGNVLEYVGGYDDWLRQGGKWTEADEAPQAQKSLPESAPVATEKSKSVEDSRATVRVKKLLEQQIAALHLETSAPDFYQSPAALVDQRLQALTQLEQQLESCFERWAELEDLQHS